MKSVERLSVHGVHSFCELVCLSAAAASFLSSDRVDLTAELLCWSLFTREFSGLHSLSVSHSVNSKLLTVSRNRERDPKSNFYFKLELFSVPPQHDSFFESRKKKVLAPPRFNLS